MDFVWVFIANLTVKKIQIHQQKPPMKPCRYHYHQQTARRSTSKFTKVLEPELEHIP